jgi:hypothetical protein
MIKYLMGSLGLLLLAGTATPASARPAGSIDCAVAGLPAAQRTLLGSAMVDGPPGDNKGFAATQHALEAPIRSCAKTNNWTDAQSYAASEWSIWKLTADELQRQSHLAAADAAILKAYVDEDPKRIASLGSASPAVLSEVTQTLRKRGAHVTESGDDRDRALASLLMLSEMNAKEREFATP